MPLLGFSWLFWGFVIQVKLAQEKGIIILVRSKQIDMWSFITFIVCAIDFGNLQGYSYGILFVGIGYASKTMDREEEARVYNYHWLI